MKIGKAIKMCRTRRNLTQGQLADKAGIGLSYVSLLERGLRNPTLTTIQSIAGALDVPLLLLVFLAMGHDEIMQLSGDLVARLSLEALFWAD